MQCRAVQRQHTCCTFEFNHAVPQKVENMSEMGGIPTAQPHSTGRHTPSTETHKHANVITRKSTHSTRMQHTRTSERQRERAKERERCEHVTSTHLSMKKQAEGSVSEPNDLTAESS